MANPRKLELVRPTKMPVFKPEEPRTFRVRIKGGDGRGGKIGINIEFEMDAATDDNDAEKVARIKVGDHEENDVLEAQTKIEAGEHVVDFLVATNDQPSKITFYDVSGEAQAIVVTKSRQPKSPTRKHEPSDEDAPVRSATGDQPRPVVAVVAAAAAAEPIPTLPASEEESISAPAMEDDVEEISAEPVEDDSIMDPPDPESSEPTVVGPTPKPDSDVDEDDPDGDMSEDERVVSSKAPPPPVPMTKPSALAAAPVATAPKPAASDEEPPVRPVVPVKRLHSPPRPAPPRDPPPDPASATGAYPKGKVPVPDEDDEDDPVPTKPLRNDPEPEDHSAAPNGGRGRLAAAAGASGCASIMAVAIVLMGLVGIGAWVYYTHPPKPDPLAMAPGLPEPNPTPVPAPKLAPVPTVQPEPSPEPVREEPQPEPEPVVPPVAKAAPLKCVWWKPEPGTKTELKRSDGHYVNEDNKFIVTCEGKTYVAGESEEICDDVECHWHHEGFVEVDENLDPVDPIGP